MYDYDKLYAAWKKYVLDFQPDAHLGIAIPTPGRVFDILDYKLYAWPGHGVAETLGYQYNEGEYMMADEYDAFIEDPHLFLQIRLYAAHLRSAGRLQGPEQPGQYPGNALLKPQYPVLRIARSAGFLQETFRGRGRSPEMDFLCGQIRWRNDQHWVIRISSADFPKRPLILWEIPCAVPAG